MNIKDKLEHWASSGISAFQIFRNCQGLWGQEEKISPNSSIMIFAVICQYGESKLYFFDEGETETADVYEKISSKTLINRTHIS